MNRRITKEMAAMAAKAMAEQLYAKRIELCYSELQRGADIFVKKYIPDPVLQVCKEYDRYFNLTKHVVFSCNRKSSIGCETSFSLPQYANFITVSELDYESLISVNEPYRSICKEVDVFKKRVYEALVILKSEKKVVECLPEAVKFIEFPETKHLPSLVYDDLRALLKSIT